MIAFFTMRPHLYRFIQLIWRWTWIALIFLPLIIFSKWLFIDIPALKTTHPTQTAFMRYRDVPVTMTWMPLAKISPHVRRMVITAEDSLFFTHHGVDWDALSAARDFNRKKGSPLRGGSTITMQLAKNLFLTPKKWMIRKVIEIPLALKLDRDLDKKRILELYLNLIEWGDGIYGAEAAARHYFNTSASALSPREAAFLVAIIPNPRKWGYLPPGPYVDKRMRRFLRE